MDSMIRYTFPIYVILVVCLSQVLLDRAQTQRIKIKKRYSGSLLLFFHWLSKAGLPEGI